MDPLHCLHMQYSTGYRRCVAGHFSLTLWDCNTARPTSHVRSQAKQVETQKPNRTKSVAGQRSCCSEIKGSCTEGSKWAEGTRKGWVKWAYTGETGLSHVGWFVSPVYQKCMEMLVGAMQSSCCIGSAVVMLHWQCRQHQAASGSQAERMQIQTVCLAAIRVQLGR